MSRPLANAAVRAAKLTRIPGVTIAEASARFGVSVYAVRRARRELGLAAMPGPAELVLAAVTNNGTRRKGKIGDLSEISKYVDYVNHDGSMPLDVRRLLDELVAEGALRVDGDHFFLLRPWP